MDERILHSIGGALAMAALGGIALFLALQFTEDGGAAHQNMRVAVGLSFSVVALVALWLSRRQGVRVAVAFFATAGLVMVMGSAMLLGTSVGSPGMSITTMLIVLAGVALGPRAALLTAMAGVAMLMCLLGAEHLGWIKGMAGNDLPPAASYATVHGATFVLIGMLMAHFSHLFREALGTIDRARQDLLRQVQQLESAQSDLQSSERRLTALLDHAPLAVLIYDQHTAEIRYANQHVLKAHGVASIQELTHTCFFTEGPFATSVFINALQETRQHGGRTLQWQSQHAEGDTLWWSLRLDVLRFEGEDHIVAFGHDITQRLKAERALIEHRAQLAEEVRERTAELMKQQHRLEGIIEALPVSLSLKDRHGRYLMCNQLFEQAHGLRKHQILGRHTQDIFDEEAAHAIREHDDKVVKHGTTVRYEASRRRLDGSIHDQLVTKAPLSDARGTIEAVLTLSVDITEQKQMQRELSAAKTEAEQLASVKSAFMANMSHEIRTPLHGVLGLTRLGLLQQQPGHPTHRLLERIQHSGRHLLGVINDILDFSKIDAGKLQLSFGAMDPAAVARDALSMVEGKAQDKGLTVLFDTHELPALVQGDAQRVRQILLNLLSNAVKFTDRGQVRLDVLVHGSHLCYVVTDSGIGMSSEAQARVFSPFEQADGSISRRFGGTGLGLSISKHLAELMGGDILLETAPGCGARFTLRLPCTLSTQEARPVEHPPKKTTLRHRLDGWRMLVVDDLEINLDILEGLLGEHGAHVDRAMNGQEALEQVRRYPADHYALVLMDVQMPIMDGLQASRALRVIRPGLNIVALTAHALPEERAQCLAAGMHGYLSKPFEPEELLEVILRHGREPSHSRAVASNTQDLTPSTFSAEADMPPEIDLRTALRRCGSKPELLYRLVTRFCDEQADFALRGQALLPDQIESLRRATHAFKGTSGNLGMIVLARHAETLETCLRAENIAEAQRALVNLHLALQQHVHTLRCWLRARAPVEAALTPTNDIAYNP